jgi:hypothetical protein
MTSLAPAIMAATSARPVDFNQNEVSALIEEYRRHECLWNTDHEDYRNRDVRRRAEQAIGEAMGKPGMFTIMVNGNEWYIYWYNHTKVDPYINLVPRGALSHIPSSNSEKRFKYISA